MLERTRVADAAWGVLVLLVVVGLGEYIGVRAWALSFTHDESLTFTSYVHDPVSSVLRSRETDANNHPLNTLAMKLGGALFGPNEMRCVGRALPPSSSTLSRWWCSSGASSADRSAFWAFRSPLQTPTSSISSRSPAATGSHWH